MYAKLDGMVSPYSELTLRALKNLSNVSNNSITLGPRQHMMLYQFAENPGTSAYDISPVRNNKKGNADYEGTKKSNNDYKDARRRIERLKDLGLIENVTASHPNIHNAQCYKLSARGIYYMISNNLRLQFGYLLKNYGDHPLFQHFLYPYIERDTISKIWDTAIFSHLFSYLHDCCKEVEETVIISQTNNQTQNGYMTRRLFSLELLEEDKDSLRSFLKQRGSEWNWVDNARITKRVTKAKAQNSISISDGRNSAFIKLYTDKTKAILVLKRKKLPEQICKFVVNGPYVCTSEPYRSYLRTLDPSRPPPPISVEESCMIRFHSFLTMRIQQLVFSIQSNYVEPSYSAAMQILRHDARFMQVRKETQDQFDRINAFFTEKQNQSG